MEEPQNLTHERVTDDLIAQYEKFFGRPLNDIERDWFKYRKTAMLRIGRPPVKGQLTLSGSAAMHILRRKLCSEKDETKRAKIEEMLRRIEEMESRSTSPQGCGVPAAWTVIE
jgi:hypothetical protein